MRGVLLVLMLSLLLPGAARADLRLCNRTSYILYAATSQLQAGARQNQGWSRVTPGDCETAIKGPISAPGLQVYARSALAHSGPQRAWGAMSPLACGMAISLCARARHRPIAPPAAIPRPSPPSTQMAAAISP